MPAPHEGQPTAISLLDVGIVLGLPALAVAAALPPRCWPRFAAVIAGFTGGSLARPPAALAQRIREVVGPRALGASPEAAARSLVAKEIEKNLMVVREHLAGNAWTQPEIIGREHLDGALAQGNGAILWVSHFQFGALITKLGLHRAGYALVHLSHPRHGFSATTFGMRFLNPIYQRAENHYLRERVILSLDGAVAAMRTLIKRLRENAVVSITVRDAGARPVAVPFMDAEHTIATGAPDLAYRTGASLIPVFTVQLADGAFRITLEAPLEIARDQPREAASTAAAARYAERLEPHVLASPGQWLPWVSI